MSTISHDLGLTELDLSVPCSRLNNAFYTGGAFVLNFANFHTPGPFVDRQSTEILSEETSAARGCNFEQRSSAD